MTSVESHTKPPAKSPPAPLIPPEIITLGKKQFENLAKLQAELIENLQEANRSWLDRMQSEANLASEFATKLTAARSIPETATLCRELASRRLEMAAEDARHLLADSQKFMETGAHLLANRWLDGGQRNTEGKGG
jgi:hypothetical protein